MTQRRMLVASIFCSSAFLAGCGSSSHTNTIVTSGPNVAQLTVNGGPIGGYVNGAFTSVQVCVPGTSNCQTISGILVDTGSVGLRILSSALTVSLPQQNGSDGNPIVECLPFVSTYTWGPVQTADVTIASESASAVPIQVIGGSNAAVPDGCSDFGGTPLSPANSLQDLGAEGLLGVGSFPQDCGEGCTQTSGNVGLYYDCATSGCTVANESLTAQVQNPVSLFATDNNGVIIELPKVDGEAATESGSLVFGIGTESNNGLGSAEIYTLNGEDNITTTYNGTQYQSFLDSGSNGIFFLDSSITGYQDCNGFYCPSSTQNLSATNEGANGTSESVSFSVADAANLLDTDNNAFNQLAGPFGNEFDWGLSFFYGRNVFTAIDGASTPGGTGPYWAY